MMEPTEFGVDKRIQTAKQWKDNICMGDTQEKDRERKQKDKIQREQWCFEMKSGD